jgi:hypothetical protein
MAPEIPRLRATVEHLAAIDRPSASAGERRAAEWIRDRLAGFGADAWVEEERAHGTYWIPLGLLTVAAGLAGLGARSRPRRLLASAVGAAAAAGIADDVSAGPHRFRRLLPQGSTWNVVAERATARRAGRWSSSPHHDAAHGGLVFAPQLVTWTADAFRLVRQAGDLPTVMALVTAGPALVALGALGAWTAPRRRHVPVVRRGGRVRDIAARAVGPGRQRQPLERGRLLEVARALAERPVEGVRVLLLSTARRRLHGGNARLRRPAIASLRGRGTEFVCLDSSARRAVVFAFISIIF